MNVNIEMLSGDDFSVLSATAKIAVSTTNVAVTVSSSCVGLGQRRYPVGLLIWITIQIICLSGVLEITYL